MKKVLVLFSGGLDSTTLVQWLMNNGYDVECLHFQYGAKNNVYEYKNVIDLCAYFGTKLHIGNLEEIMRLFKSNLLKGQGEVSDESYFGDEMSKNILPARNSIFLSVAAGVAESKGIGHISIGTYLPGLFPDAKAEYVSYMAEALRLGTGNKVRLIAPFTEMEWNGSDLLRYGLANKVPYHLTRTCHKDQEISCGKCGVCQMRLEIFNRVGVKDPLPYEINHE